VIRRKTETMKRSPRIALGKARRRELHHLPPASIVL